MLGKTSSAAGAQRISADLSLAATRIEAGGKLVSLQREELHLLLDTLREIGSLPAAAVREEIEALRLAGGVIRLLLTEAEHATLCAAVARCARERRARYPVFLDLLRLLVLRRDRVPAGRALRA